MNTIDLQKTITEIQDKIEEFPTLGDKKQKLLSELEAIKKDISAVEVPVMYGEVYFSLVAKGKALLEEFTLRTDAKLLLEKIRYYIGYLYAAQADFTGNSKQVNTYYRIFLITSFLFVMLSPMMLTPIFTLLFIFPIFAGMKGVKRRSKNGFTLTMLVAPAALMTGILWAKNMLDVLYSPSLAAEHIAQSAGVTSPILVQILTFVPPILGSILFIMGIVMSITGFKIKKYFV